MIDRIRRGLNYQHRCLCLARGLLCRTVIHCNLQVTYRCNFRCQICDFYKPPYDHAHELTLDQVRVIGRKLSQLGTIIISLAGGEPLIRPDLCDIIRILTESNHFPVLITNGWFVDETLARDIGRAGLQEISVSLDYADASKHDAQRGQPGAWDQAVKALELLRRSRRSKTNRVHMISVLMDDNVDQIEPLIRLARDIGVTYMVNLYSWSRGTKRPHTPGSAVTEHLLGLKRTYPEFISLTSYLERMDEAISAGGIGDCQAGRLAFNIDAQGRVARCADRADEAVGNLLTDDVHELYDRLRRVQRTQACAACWTSCRGFAECMHAAPRWRQFREFYISVRPHA